jgi:hypothetical protein
MMLCPNYASNRASASTHIKGCGGDRYATPKTKPMALHEQIEMRFFNTLLNSDG